MFCKVFHIDRCANTGANSYIPITLLPLYTIHQGPRVTLRISDHDISTPPRVPVLWRDARYQRRGGIANTRMDRNLATIPIPTLLVGDPIARSFSPIPTVYVENH